MPRLSASDITVGLRAVKAVAMADGVFDDREKKLLKAASRALTPDGAPIDTDTLDTITPEETARIVTDSATRSRIVQAQIIMSLIDGDIDESESRVIKDFAKALDVDEPRLKNIDQLLRHHHQLLKLDLSRHSEMVDEAMRHAYRENGLRGAWKTMAPMLTSSLALDEKLAAKYRALGELDPDTFGYRYFMHMVERDFSFPGEPAGFPEEFIKHDCCHVLGGYDTDPSGECQVVGFICGFMKTDPFWYLFMIAVHMHLGVETFHKNALGFRAFDADEVITALERGARVTEDIYVPGFDWWPLFPMPIADVRAKYNVT